MAKQLKKEAAKKVKKPRVITQEQRTKWNKQKRDKRQSLKVSTIQGCPEPPFAVKPKKKLYQCAMCGKREESYNWTRHWSQNHRNAKKRELLKCTLNDETRIRTFTWK